MVRGHSELKKPETQLGRNEEKEKERDFHFEFILYHS